MENAETNCILVPTDTGLYAYIAPTSSIADACETIIEVKPWRSS